MYASIRRYKTKPGVAAELAQRVNQGAVPMLSQVSGFVAYYVVDAGNDVAVSVSVFQDEAGSIESNRIAASWVKENTASLVSGTPEIMAGEVTVYKAV